jgi:hypothetical protein
MTAQGRARRGGMAQTRLPMRKSVAWMTLVSRLTWSSFLQRRLGPPH